MEVVPETKIKGPLRTALEYPNFSSYGLAVLCLIVVSDDLGIAFNAPSPDIAGLLEMSWMQKGEKGA